MKTKSKITAYTVHSIAAAVLLLNGQICVAGTATWLGFQDSAWENPNNWTSGGPPNGPSDIAIFDGSSQRQVNISTPVEVDSIIFNSVAGPFTISVSSSAPCAGGRLILGGPGIIDNSDVLQTLVAANSGRIAFNNASTARDATIICDGGSNVTCS